MESFPSHRRMSHSETFSDALSSADVTPLFFGFADPALKGSAGAMRRMAVGPSDQFCAMKFMRFCPFLQVTKETRLVVSLLQVPSGSATEATQFRELLRPAALTFYSFPQASVAGSSFVKTR